MLKRTSAVVLAFAILGFSSPLLAQKAGAGFALQQKGSRNLAVVVPSDPEKRWEEYLESQDMKEGENEYNNFPFFIARGIARVGKPFGPGWVPSRTVASESALLHAKSQLASYLGIAITSERTLNLIKQGMEVPPVLEKDAKTLSLMDKLNLLGHKQLDDLIKKFDPNWDGSGKSLEEKKKRVVAMRRIFAENVAGKARHLILGAAPIFNAEGPNIDGHYTVVVGIVWSPRMALVAESLANPQSSVPPATPYKSVSEQLKDMRENDDNSLAAFQGVRVWTNEKGEAEVVSSAATERLGSSLIEEEETAFRARSQIAQFVAEPLTLGSRSKSRETLDFYIDKSTGAFNDGQLVIDITATARTLNIVGSKVIYRWKGRHPISKNDMQVTVVSWSPTSRVKAGGLSDRIMKKNNKPSKEGSVSPGGLSGPSTKKSDF
ncbi:MAG: hypothetical protein HYY96_03420 [Candidatus Tectomicrobia bacterium]|nr:hypothetical protein [Candidatus Tectomicrobia bacterium]